MDLCKTRTYAFKTPLPRSPYFQYVSLRCSSFTRISSFFRRSDMRQLIEKSGFIRSFLCHYPLMLVDGLVVFFCTCTTFASCIIVGFTGTVIHVVYPTEIFSSMISTFPSGLHFSLRIGNEIISPIGDRPILPLYSIDNHFLIYLIISSN